MGLARLPGRSSGTQSSGVDAEGGQRASAARRLPAPHSIRGILALVLALIVIPALLVQGLIYYSRFETRRAEEYRANLEVARSVAIAFDMFVRDLLHQQLTVGQALYLVGDRLTPEETQSLLATSASEYAAIDYYSWTAPSGRVLASSQPDAVGFDVSVRPYFQEIVAGRPWVVSDLFLGGRTGEATFVVARGIRDSRGNLQGIVSAAVDPRRLGAVMAVPRDHQGAVSIVDRQGRGVYRYPELDWAWEQRNWIETQPIIAEGLAGREVVGEFVSLIDGQVRMTGLSPIPSVGWVASGNRPEAVAMAPVRQAVLRDFGLLALAVVAAALVAVWAGRLLISPLDRLREHALALGRGEQPHRVAIDRPIELRQVGDALDSMATEIRARDAQRRDLLAIVSHDIRNPLAVIRGQAQLARRRLLRGDPPDRETLIASLGGIEDATRRLDALIEELRESAPANGDETIVLRRASVDLVALVRAAVEAEQLASERHQLRLTAREPALTGVWDGARLERVIGNLLSNAVKYSPEGSAIAVTVERDGREAVLSVADQGVGIPAADVPYVFLPYRRGHNVGTVDGTGLGLTGASRIVTQHGGTIAVQSVEGRGSTFTVRLPLDPSEPAATSSPPTT
jgi:signal transduction histidine kinase